MAPVTTLVDFGLAVGAEIPSDVFLIGSATQGIIGTNVLGTVSVLADYSDRLQSLSVQRTSDRVNGPLVSYNAGTASVTLLNLDGLLDPYAIEQAGLTAPGVLMRIRELHGGVVYPVFYGFVDTWEPRADAPTLATVTVTATDGFGLLNQQLAELALPIGAGSLVSTRITAVLDAVAWPADLRSIGAASSTLQQTTFGASGLSLIQDAVTAEVGEFYQQPDGVMYFRGRAAVVSDARSSTSQATFGSDIAGGEIPYVGRPESAWDKSGLHNVVVAGIDGDDGRVSAEDAASKSRYGTLTLPATDLQLPNLVDAQSWANYVLAQDSVPAYRMTAITLNGALDDAGIPVMVQALGRRFGDRVTVVRRPPAEPFGSIVDERDMHIRGIGHEWSVETRQWVTTFSLAPAARIPFFVIGSATQGVIGTNVLAW